MSTAQFRIAKLQVYNWGTFSNIHDIPIAERGFLFVGRSGTGKTTLLDAFSTLLVPPKWVDFNAAAREGERGSRDRSLLSYVRGAWAEQQDDDSGLIVTRYLRTGTTWSALALTYCNDAAETVVLVQLFWIRGKSNNREDLRRHYLIFDRPFDLRALSDFQLDVRKMKQKLPDVFAREDFAPYAERFCRRLGIENELALKLLHRTQSAKNLGDLNTFLRDFMLDRPETFEAADRLVTEFAELNAAHQAVVTAREQIQILVPAREEHLRFGAFARREKELSDLRSGLDSYKRALRAGLLQKRIAELEDELNVRRAEEQSKAAELNNREADLKDLQRQRLEAGGLQIEQLERERRDLAIRRDESLSKRGKAQRTCEQLGWLLPDQPAEFASLVNAAQQEIEQWREWQEKSRDRYAALSANLAGLEKEFSEARDEVESLLRQPSNVPANMLRLRATLTEELGLAEAALPFAAELMEVLPKEEGWRGAIERVLGGFALSLLVEERHYPAVSEYVNRTFLRGERLFYNRVGRDQVQPVQSRQPNSLIYKLQIKEGTFLGYLRSTLLQRFDYACVDSMQAFRNSEKAVTRQGQVRHGKDRHEKDDRRDLNDRSRWVLGFDNRAKRALFERKAQDAGVGIERCRSDMRSLKAEDDNRRQRALNCQTLVNLQWQELDARPVLERINAIDKKLRELQEGNTVLGELARRIEAQTALVNRASQILIEVKSQVGGTEKEMKKYASDLSALRNHSSALSDAQGAELSKYFDGLGQSLTLERLDEQAHRVDKKLSEEMDSLAEARNQAAKAIERRFSEFKRRWPADAADVDDSLASASDFLAKLRRLESDRLPDYEERFFDLLRNQSHQNLAALSTHLNQARKTIFDRLNLVNDSLSKAEFGPGTYLHIDPTDRNLDDVREFKQEIQRALSHAWSDDREQAEERFLILRRLVERLGGQESEQKRWRTLVLDVRQHVDFIGREMDINGVQVEVYRGGSGKSGGQRQKLATTCLAAALRYQLGGDDHGLPQYAPVVLDEAFDKADNEFTALVMNIFASFGFQMIVATPLKSVMTLEPFIGGACFVDITERRHSSVLMIEYDAERKRLNLPTRSYDEAGAAVS